VIVGFYDSKIIFAKTFKRVAAYSYNIYLWHFIFIIPVELYFGTGIMGFVCYISLTCIMAVFSTHFIERRFLSYRAPLLKFLQPVRSIEAKQSVSPVEVLR
jgi:peptidoglycan/LPS O-acetylase OafA/YrhL